MVFSSLEFLFLYFAISIFIYFAVPLKWRNAVLLVVSLVFYGWGEPVYVFLMIGTILIDYVCGYLTDKYKTRGNIKAARAAMIAAIVSNLLLLGFFKYWNFIIDNVNSLFSLSIKTVSVSLPIGISFYTFQALSYVIDVYRSDARVQKNPVSFGAYVTLFPQLIAGPIVRYQDVDDQLRQRPHNIVMMSSGIRTFICGFAKKVLLANSAGAMWETFRDSDTVLGAWLGIIFFSFQIYFDFSGYSDMAIGLGKMLGFTFRENFYYPYTSKSITEFWRRWHISLGTWFREYVYIPLGGNRRGGGRTIFNIFVVWFLTGLWHGASWNFILWGLYYFVILMLEKTFLLKILKKAPSALSRVYSLTLILFGWWLFAFDNMSEGVAYLGKMFGAAPATSGAVNFDAISCIVLAVILVVASTPLPKKLYHKLYDRYAAARWVSFALSMGAMLICTAYLVNSSYNPFLYFRF
ncbi:MAG: MBOAT family protein [Clostridia bacterium]|nr:MBOAT family protein [Clostridia bacterium]